MPTKEEEEEDVFNDTLQKSTSSSRVTEGESLRARGRGNLLLHIIQECLHNISLNRNVVQALLKMPVLTLHPIREWVF
jgi:hypothetical protein